MNDRANEKISYQRTLGTLFASFSVLAFGTLSLLSNFSMDLYSITFMLSIVIPASLSMGFLGFIIGKILDEGGGLAPAKKIKKKTNTAENPYKMQSMFASSELSQQDASSMFDSNEEIKGNDEF